MVTSLEDVRKSPEKTQHNLWRRETPGASGWQRTAHADDPNKYFMFSADCHAVEPSTYLEGIEPEYKARLPHMETRGDGSQWLITEGNRPQRVRGPSGAPKQGDEGAEKSGGMAMATSPLDDEDVLRNS